MESQIIVINDFTQCTSYFQKVLSTYYGSQLVLTNVRDGDGKDDIDHFGVSTLAMNGGNFAAHFQVL